jgi:hypothetical protein
VLDGVEDHDTLPIVFRWAGFIVISAHRIKAAISDRRDRPSQRNGQR